MFCTEILGNGSQAPSDDVTLPNRAERGDLRANDGGKKSSAVTLLRSLAHLLGLGQDADDFRVEVCYSVHVASVGTVIPAAHKVGCALNDQSEPEKNNSIRRANSDELC